MTASWFKLALAFVAFWTFYHRPTFFSFFLYFFSLFLMCGYHFNGPWWLACHIFYQLSSLAVVEQISPEINKKSNYKRWNNDYQQNNILKAIFCLLYALIVDQLIWFYTLSTIIQRYTLLAFLTTFWAVSHSLLVVPNHRSASWPCSIHHFLPFVFLVAAAQAITLPITSQTVKRTSFALKFLTAFWKNKSLCTEIATQIERATCTILNAVAAFWFSTFGKTFHTYASWCFFIKLSLITGKRAWIAVTCTITSWAVRRTIFTIQTCLIQKGLWWTFTGIFLFWKLKFSLGAFYTLESWLTFGTEWNGLLASYAMSSIEEEIFWALTQAKCR